jgi:outer membrane receptor protein involved in Fe transport
MRSFEMAKAFRFTSQLLVVVSILAFAAIAAMAQATTGSLRGTVMDASGALVAGATVTVKNEATASEIKTTSSGDGTYEVSGLLPGTYAVTVEAANFKRSVGTGVSVKVGIVNPYDARLEAGNVSETVTVTAGTEEIVQRDQSQISTTIESRRVTDLPSNGAGGGIDTLALLAPGVVSNRSGGTNTNGTGLSVNGNRGRSNNFQIDGADNNDLSVAGPALFVDFQDSIQEFQVITNNFSAQYGRNQGAIVNIVTKGGTNDFHGTGFWFHQDNKNLNSLDNIEKASGQTKPNASLYNVFGGTFGGPVWAPNLKGDGPRIWRGTNRAFFFVAYQGIRNPALSTGRSSNLAILGSELARLQATFPTNNLIQNYARFSPFAITLGGPALINSSIAQTQTSRSFNLGGLLGGCPRSITVGSAVPTSTATATLGQSCGTYTAYINPATGAPFLAGGPFDVINLGTAAAPNLFQLAQYERTVPTGYTETYYSYRFDVKASDKDNVTFRFLNQKSAAQNSIGTISSGFNGDIPAGSRNIGGNWTRQLNNTMVNEFRASYQKINVEFGGGCTTGTPGCIPGPAEIGESLANVTFGALGLTKTNTFTGFGAATNLPQGRIGKVYQLADNLTVVKGRHSLTLGAEWKKLTNLSPFLPNYNGQFTFNSTTRIINNAPNVVAITLGDPLLTFKERDQYYYVQDDFKIRPNLTLNLGLRYEYTGQPLNQLHDQSVARESNAATAFFNPAIPIEQRTVPKIPADKNNFAPRIGFAWSPHFWKGLLGEDATVIRGGFSIAYDAAYYNILSNVQNAAPFSAALSIPVGSLPSSGSPAPLPADARGDAIRAAALAAGILPRGLLNPRFLTQTNVAPDFHSPYSEQFSLGVQHQFGRNHVAEVRYVGTHGVGLFQNINGNFFIKPLVAGILNWFGSGVNLPSFANLLPTGTTFQTCTDVIGTPDNEGACNQRQFPFASITTRANTSQSIYHSMQSRYNGRFFNNALSLGAAYTWSKTIDDSSEIFAQTDILSPNAQNPFCINRCERSLSALDRPHVFSMNFIYDVPLFKEQRGPVGHLLGGWQFNGTYILTSGATWTPGQTFNGAFGLGNTYLTAGDRPFVTNASVDPRQVGISQLDAAILFGAPLTNIDGFYSMNQANITGDFVAVNPADVHFVFNGPGAARIFGTPFGTSARNSLRGPIFNQLNMSVFKNIKVIERLTVQLRAEAFNVLNHPNPGFGVERGDYLPNKDVGNAGAEGVGFAENGDIELARRVVQVGLRIIF